MISFMIAHKQKLIVQVLFLFLVAARVFSFPSFAQADVPNSLDNTKNFDKAFIQSGESFKKSRDNFTAGVLNSKLNAKQNQAGFFYNVTEIGGQTIMTWIVGPSIQTDETLTVFGQGIVPSLSQYMAQMYEQKPASTQTYLADLFRSAKIVSTVQAQGIGFSSLSPVLSIWKTTRNIAYFFFVVLFLVIGFMVMFRKKISGQTVLTVQQALPNIIVSLIFVSFSYAISGFLIDLMYLSLYLIIGLFNGAANILDVNIFQLGSKFTSDGFRQSDEIIESIIEQAGAGDFWQKLPGISVGVIVSIGILFGVIKLFFELLKSYVSILLSISFAPIILLTGAIPGKNSFASWIKSMVGNLLAFPTVLLVLVVSETITSSTIATGGFAPPFLLGPTIGGGSALAGFVGIGMLLAAPEIVQQIKKTIGVSSGVFGELGKAAGEQLSKGEIGIPLAAQGAGFGIGGVNSLSRSIAAGTTDPRQLIQDTLYGFKDQAGIHGGAIRLGKKFGDAGKTARVLIDRTKEGRIGDAEEPTKLLAELLKPRKEQHDPAEDKLKDETPTDTPG